MIKVSVMAQRTTQEYDTPKELYLENGVFRDMCDQSGISLTEIEKAADERLKYAKQS